MNAPIAIDRALPDWPRLMAVDLAAAYLGIGASTLRQRGPQPKKLGTRTLYDRTDLDRFADALGEQPLDEAAREAEGGDIAARVKERLAHVAR